MYLHDNNKDPTNVKVDDDLCDILIDQLAEDFVEVRYLSGVSDVSAPRFFLDSRKDFSWPRSTRIHEAKSR